MRLRRRTTPQWRPRRHCATDTDPTNNFTTWRAAPRIFLFLPTDCTDHVACHSIDATARRKSRHTQAQHRKGEHKTGAPEAIRRRTMARARAPRRRRSGRTRRCGLCGLEEDMGTVRVRALCMIRTVACSLSRSYMASVRSECTVRAFTAATRTTRPRAATRNQL